VGKIQKAKLIKKMKSCINGDELLDQQLVLLDEIMAISN